MVEKPVNPMDGLRVECVGNRHDNTCPPGGGGGGRVAVRGANHHAGATCWRGRRDRRCAPGAAPPGVLILRARCAGRGDERSEEEEAAASRQRAAARAPVLAGSSTVQY